MANIRKIENVVKNKIPKDSCIRLGGMADPFQEAEQTEKITLETIKILNKHRVHYLIVTKSHMVADDEYLDAMDKELAHIQVSVTCLDDMRAIIYEKAPIPSLRIKAIYKLQRAGFDVALRVSPLIEEYIDFGLLNALYVDKCLIEFLRVNAFIKGHFSDVNYEKYTVWQSNYWHLPLDEKCRLLEKIHLPNVSVCEDVDEHYDFWRRYFNPNRRDCCNLRINKSGSLPSLVDKEESIWNY